MIKPYPTASREAYGARRAGGVRHWGWDLAGSEGSHVAAPEPGIVVEAASNGSDRTIKLAPPWDGYGPGIVLIRGQSGVWHLLAHVRPQVAAGDLVDEGQTVATMTRGVGAAGPHVHWEVRTGVPHDSPSNRGANTADPARWLDDSWTSRLRLDAKRAAAPRDDAGGGAGLLLLLALLLLADRR